mgnify:CR=1 FL=1
MGGFLCYFFLGERGLERLVVEMYARGLSMRDIEAASDVVVWAVDAGPGAERTHNLQRPAGRANHKPAPRKPLISK